MNVEGEEFGGGGEATAVESGGVGGSEAEDGDVAAEEGEGVGENGVDEDGRSTEFGVAAFVSEEVEGG